MPQLPHLFSTTGWRVLFSGLSLAVATYASPALGDEIASSSLRRTAIVRAVEDARPSVVNIHGRKTVRDTTAMSEAARQVNGMGTGVIIDPRGYIITNYHVVDGVARIQVTMHDEKELVARLVAHDPKTDLAIIKIESDKPLPVIRTGTSRDLMPGEPVIAVGNAFGYTHTVTRGIISALHRTVQVSDDQKYHDLIQTDASINPGNSGGALVNLRGELVGINSAIISRTGGNVGIGFAIPVNMARTIVDQLIATGTVRRGLLGVQIRDVSPEVAATLGLPGNSGALVAEVNPNSAAERAGIRIEDVIVSVNGKPLRDSGSLKNAIGLLPPGAEVTVGLIRDGREQTVKAVLGELAQPPRVTAVTPEPQRPTLDTVFEGAEIVDNSTPDGVPGLLVVRVDPDSPAQERGLAAGDVITKVNRIRVRSLAEAVPIMQDGGAIILEVQRGTRSRLVLMR